MVEREIKRGWIYPCWDNSLEWDDRWLAIPIDTAPVDTRKGLMGTIGRCRCGNGCKPIRVEVVVREKKG